MKNSSHLAIDLRMYRMSGIGRYLRTLLPNLIPRLNATQIFALGDPQDLRGESWAQDPRISFRTHKARIFSVAEQLAMLSGLYRGVDLLWMPQYNVPVLYHGPMVVTVHDLCQLAMPETLGSPLQRRYARFLFAQVSSRASAVLCVSEFTANEASRLAGIDRERLTVAHCCVDDFWSVAATTGPPPRPCPYFLVVGNLKKHKNLLSAIVAFQRIANKIPHDLVIVGKRQGFLNAESGLDALLSKSGSRIVFTGHVTDEDLRRYYRYAAGLVFPSLYEGFGYPLLEAMALECPIACSRAASLPEVARDAALYFDPSSPEEIADALLSLSMDETLKADRRQKGTARLQRCRGNEAGEVVASVINRLLKLS